MKLMCEIWFWLLVVNVVVTFALVSLGDYPRTRSAVPRWADALSFIFYLSLAVALFVAIWGRA
jgi:hypothetical protein